jgi:hypothetical protein
MPRAGRRSWGQGARPTSGFGTGWCPAGIRGPGRWDSLACYCQSPLLGPTPHQNPHFVWIRAHTAPATARGSRRRAAAWRNRTRHPNLKLTPFCRPGSRTASLGYETSSYGPTDGLARTSPVGVGPSWLATKSHTAVQAAVATALWTFLPKTCVLASFYRPAFARARSSAGVANCSKNSKRARALSLRSLPASARRRVETPKKR